jgi:hypothetical protein
MGKVALIFVFNHRYDKNIDILERIYKDRFSHIYHIVPFYNGGKKNVISVYENSFYFEGYLAQAYAKYFNEEYENYFFVADDLILNPGINESNYKDHFGLTNGQSYIPEIFCLDNLTNRETLHFTLDKSFIKKESKFHWWRIKQAVRYEHENEGVENAKELPGYVEAMDKLKKHGYHVKPLTFHDLYGYFPRLSALGRERMHALRYLYRINRYNRKFKLAYPIVASYSDILIVSKSAIAKFCHYCGVFASNHLFVEYAIPTALLLATEKVITEREIGKRGIIYWPQHEPAIYEEGIGKYDYKLSNLLQNFPENKLYIHPIKLSKWQTETELENQS